MNKADGSSAVREGRGIASILRDQGEIWRRILCGEMKPEDLLTSQGYRQAAVQLLIKLRTLAGGFLKQWWFLLLPVLLFIVGVVLLITLASPSSAAAVAALIATGAGALGISWKTIASTLGKVASKAEGPLWETEVLQALIVESTITPENAQSRRMALLMRTASPVASLPAPSGSMASEAQVRG